MSLPIRPREHSFPKTLNSPPSARSTSSRPSTITSPIESARQPTGVQYWIGSWSSPVRSHRGTSQAISTVLAWKATTQWNVAPRTIIRPRTNRGEWYLHRYQSTNISRTSRSWTTLSTTTRHRLDQEKRTGIATTSRRGPFPAERSRTKTQSASRGPLMICFADSTESPRNRVAEEPSSVVNTNEMGEMWEPWECRRRDAARAEMLQVARRRIVEIWTASC